MKVLMLIPSITNYFMFLEELTLKLIEEGHEVGLVSSPRHFNQVDCYGDKPAGDYFPLDLPQGMSPANHWKAMKGLKKVIEDYQPDILHAHTGAGMFTASLTRQFGGLKQKPFFMATHHGLLSPATRGWWRWVLGNAERWAMGKQKANYVLNVSDLKWLRKTGFRGQIGSYKQSRGIGCRIDLFDSSKYTHEDRTVLREKLGVKPEDITLIFVGRHVWFKGYDLVIKAYMKLAEEYEHLKLILLGQPYRVHPSGLSETETTAMQAHPGIIKMGWVNNVQDYLIAADAMLFPSEREGMPVNLMEAQSMGLPVITRDTRGCNEIVEAGVSGLLLKERSLDELLAATRQLIENPGLLSAMGEAARKKRKQFDRMLWVKEQIAIYREITSAG